MPSTYIKKDGTISARSNRVPGKQVMGPNGWPILVDADDPRPVLPKMKGVAAIPKPPATIAAQPTTTVAPAGQTTPPKFPALPGPAVLPDGTVKPVPPDPSAVGSRPTEAIKNFYGKLKDKAEEHGFTPAAAKKIDDKVNKLAADDRSYNERLGEAHAQAAAFDTAAKAWKAKVKEILTERR